MIYIEYHEYLNRYHDAQKNYNDILSEKERMFELTQPKAVRYDTELVMSNDVEPANQFDKYIMLKEVKRLDERLSEAKSILEDRERLLEMKKTELLQSNDVIDKIYIMKFINHTKPKHIAVKVGYSEVHIYRIIRSIRKKLT